METALLEASGEFKAGPAGVVPMDFKNLQQELQGFLVDLHKIDTMGGSSAVSVAA